MPTLVTGQSACVANLTNDEGLAEYSDAFIRFQLPEIADILSVTSATFTVRCSYVMSDDDGIVVAAVECDNVGAWDETSSDTVLNALSFNGSLDSQSVTSIGTLNFDITGDATKGMTKIYADSTNPGYCTVKFTNDEQTGPGTNPETTIKHGRNLSHREYREYNTRGSSSYYPYLTIVYTQDIPAVGTLSLILDDITITAFGGETPGLDLTLDDITLAATGDITTYGALSITLEDIAISALGVVLGWTIFTAIDDTQIDHYTDPCRCHRQAGSDRITSTDVTYDHFSEFGIE